MIPKLLHQVWLGKTVFPEKFKNWRDNWRELHPEWEYKLWTEDEIIEIHPLVERARSFSSKSNVVRIWAVLNHGGVYADVDFDWNRSLNPFLVDRAFASMEAPNLYCNAIFGAEANHEWVRWMFDHLAEYVDRRPPWGPYLMTEGIRVMGRNVKTLPTNYFYPYSWHQRHQDASNFPDSYAVHHWNKSWMKNEAGA